MLHLVGDAGQKSDLLAGAVNGRHGPVGTHDGQWNRRVSRPRADIQDGLHLDPPIPSPQQQRERIGVVLDRRLDRISDSREVQCSVRLDHRREVGGEEVELGGQNRNLPPIQNPR